MPAISSDGDGGANIGKHNNDERQEQNRDIELEFRLVTDGRLYLVKTEAYIGLDQYCMEMCMPSRKLVAILCMPEKMIEKVCDKIDIATDNFKSYVSVINSFFSRLERLETKQYTPIAIVAYQDS